MNLFETLKQMNEEDVKNGTRLVAISYAFVSANKVKQGAVVEMGIDSEGLYDLLNDNVFPILILVNRMEYENNKNQH